MWELPSDPHHPEQWNLQEIQVGRVGCLGLSGSLVYVWLSKPRHLWLQGKHIIFMLISICMHLQLTMKNAHHPQECSLDFLSTCQRVITPTENLSCFPVSPVIYVSRQLAEETFCSTHSSLCTHILTSLIDMHPSWFLLPLLRRTISCSCR